MTATSAVEKTKGTERGCHKAQANTRKNQGASYHILDIAPCLAFSSLSFLLAYLALVLVTLPLSFFSRFFSESVDFEFANDRSIMVFLARITVLLHGRTAQLGRSVGPPNRWLELFDRMRITHGKNKGTAGPMLVGAKSKGNDNCLSSRFQYGQLGQTSQTEWGKMSLRKAYVTFLFLSPAS